MQRRWPALIMRRFAYGLLLGLWVIPAVLAVALLSGWAPVRATDEPSRWETSFTRRAVAASVARQAAKLQNPIEPTSIKLRSGLRLYRDNCSGCHGDSGRPSHWGTTAFYPRVPQFDTESPTKPDWQMFWIVKRGVRYTGMGAWEGELSDENIWTVVTFLSHLKDLPPDVQGEWRGLRQQSH